MQHKSFNDYTGENVFMNKEKNVPNTDTNNISRNGERKGQADRSLRSVSLPFLNPHFVNPHILSSVPYKYDFFLLILYYVINTPIHSYIYVYCNNIFT